MPQNTKRTLFPDYSSSLSKGMGPPIAEKKVKTSDQVNSEMIQQLREEMVRLQQSMESINLRMIALEVWNLLTLE